MRSPVEEMVDDLCLEYLDPLPVRHFLGVPLHLEDRQSSPGVQELELVFSKIGFGLHLDVEGEYDGVLLLVLQHGARPHHVLPHHRTDPHSRVPEGPQ